LHIVLLVVVLVSSHYQVFLCFLKANGTYCFGSFTCDVDVGHVLLGSSVDFRVLLGILILVMVLLSVVLWWLLNTTGISSQVLERRRMTQLWFAHD
jgi:hypothetical protein